MIPCAKNLQEAVNHFLNNNSPISCQNRKAEKICKTLEEAEMFYAKRPKKTRNKVRPIKTK